MLETIQTFLPRYGLFGLLFGSFLGSLIFFPAPLEVIATSVVVMGYNPFQVAIVMTFGSVVGGVVNYYLGIAGSKVMLKERDVKMVEEWINRWGDPVVFITSLLPFPFDIVAVAVGILRMRFRDFLVASTLGKMIKFLFFALLGSFVWEYFGIRMFSLD